MAEDDGEQRDDDDSENHAQRGTVAALVLLRLFDGLLLQLPAADLFRLLPFLGQPALPLESFGDLPLILPAQFGVPELLPDHFTQLFVAGRR